MGQARTRTRRRSGEPRRLLLAAAEEAFTERGYQASTREVAQRAGVSEPLIFRYFSSKAGLFEAAMVKPFVEFVDQFVASSTPATHVETDDQGLYELTHHFVAGLYDLFCANRGLVAMLWSSQAHSESDLAGQDLFRDVWTALDKLVDLGAHAARGRRARNEIATRAVLSMIAGMAVAGPSYRGGKVPPRDAVVEELTKIVHYGRLSTD